MRAKSKDFTLTCEQNLKVSLCGFQFSMTFIKNVISSCEETFIFKRRENMTWTMVDLKRLVNKGAEDIRGGLNER